MQDKTNAAMLGAVTALALNWQRNEDDNDRRLRGVKEKTIENTDSLRALMSHGSMIRLRLPSVMDFQIGVAMSNPTSVSPSTVPSPIKLFRPELGPDAVSNMKWPCGVGTFENGNVSELGELTALGLALTYQEERAHLLGLTQEKPPSLTGLVQINSSAHQMIAVLATLQLTPDQYKAAWQKVFTGLSVSTADPHAGMPLIGAPNGANNVASVAFVPSSAKSDRAMRIRITASNGGPLAALQDVVSIAFASEWKDTSGNPVIPAIVGSQGLFASTASSTGFTLQLGTGIPANTSQDFSIIISNGGAGANPNT